MTILKTKPSNVGTDKWVPHEGPQEFALMQPSSIFEILFGGSRGPGKTDAGLVWVEEPDLIANPNYRALVIRKNADDLSDWIDRANMMYAHDKAEIAYRPAVITFPSGAKIKTGHLKDAQAYTKYQGHEYHRILIEELTQIPDEKRYLQLIASCRSTIPELRPQVFATANPGGVGHGWVKSRFIDVIQPGNVYTDEDGIRRIFIPATIEDNPSLMINDPQYVRFLDSLKEKDPDLWKAWRLGDWDVFAGQVFKEFRYVTHVVDEFDFPLDMCKKIITFDWGYNDPGVANFLAFCPENQYGVKRVYQYREIFQNEKTPEQWANDLKIFTKIENIDYMVLPHDCFSKLGGRQSIADVFQRELGIPIKAGRTLDKGARLNRKAILHQYLSMARDGKPYFQIHSNCKNTIETLPQLIYSETNPEDVDTTGPDHCYDATSLGLMTEYSGGTKGGPVKVHRNVATGKVIQDTMGNYKAPDFKTLLGKQSHKRSVKL